ncbi:gene transfer agent family protein [Phyllobacterium sp. BT25]|uniref:Gene transfer agent family protein n=1 Tax=Phyllobacterium pellucidum TaxID=2740464 RepID=A0A849VMQ2_9HYPH|nr:gene transfer agent family protein [Phyllobacterium pellucidum]NTS30666.1 gene transfer agent family protein [Phyllobacterium pellucidum]
MRQGKEIVWPGGEHTFMLNIGELRALEQKTNAGAFVTMTRLISSQWKIDDVISTIRLGLVGGGMSEQEARSIVDRALDLASAYKLAITAALILEHSLMWDANDTPGEQPAGEGS